jgi:hypothetical protein
MAEKEKPKPDSKESLKNIFELNKTPKPEDLDKMVQSWGQKRKPKKK